VANSRKYASICLQELRKTAKYTFAELVTELRFSLKQPTCIEGMLPIQLHCSVFPCNEIPEVHESQVTKLCMDVINICKS
jgi:hypothetical protein